jgi:molybdenum cofactor cytidylyltransferase
MISAIILAAGQSRRMGRPKMLLPWGNQTVIGKVITTFLNAGIEHVIVVTGGAGAEMEKILEQYPVRTVHNSDYAAGEMLSSLQRGLRAIPDQAQATLIGLGDQPQVEERSVRLICEAYRENRSELIMPSFQMRRGHPWLVTRHFWEEILRLKPPQTPRDFLNKHTGLIRYVNVDTPTILADLDTPEDYEKNRPK